MTTRRAQCSCGRLAAICEGEPVRVSVCHCLECKRRSGSAFSNNARFPEARVSFEGTSKAYVRVSDAGNRVTYFFCPECGTTVHYKIDAQPGLVAIPVGAFADLYFPPPFLSFYHQSRRTPWVGIGAEPLERID
jgi:hypothetical protein